MDYLKELENEWLEEFRKELSENPVLQEYRDELLKEGMSEDRAIKRVSVDFSAICGAKSAIKAISNYLEHNDKETLANIIENSRKALKYKTFRIFIADILREKDVREKRPYKRLSTIKKEKEILDLIRFCKKLGYPLESEHTVMSCFALTAKKINVSQSYVKDVYKNRDRDKSLLDQKLPEEIQKLLDTYFWGNILKMNGGNAPNDWESFKALYDKVHEVLSFSEVINYGKIEGGTI